MAIRTYCPRCTQPLSVPRKRTGGYVQCPRCQGRFWVAKDAADGETPADAQPAGPRDALPAAAADSAAANGPSPASSARPMAAPPLAPPKVARFVAAEAGDSTLKPAADGQLPCLQLLEDETPDQVQTSRGTVRPWVLCSALSLSIALSITLATVDFDAASATSQEKAAALGIIETEYFGNPEQGPLAFYQQQLRAATQAHCRGNGKAEHQYYLRVLNLLRAEPPGGAGSALAPAAGSERGITGSRDRDRRLQQQIVTVLEE
jgi:hypothetical protein